jgi:hypothetical protein
MDGSLTPSGMGAPPIITLIRERKKFYRTKIGDKIMRTLNFILVGCSLMAGCNSLSSGDSNTLLTGRVVYVQSDIPGDWRGAVGARVTAYQNDMEVSFAIITSDDGDFQLKDVQPGIYDIVFTTPEKFHPTKINDVKITEGKNTLSEIIRMNTFSVPISDSLSISIWFKRDVSEAEIQKLIAESGCKLSARHSSLLTGVAVYNLKIPNGRIQLEVIEWFLKKNKVLAAMVGTVTPVDG